MPAQAIARPYGKIANPDHPGAQLGSRLSAGRARASIESEIAGRNRPKSPILSGSWLGDGSDADAADHRDQNHFRYLVVPPGLLRHQYCHVRPDRRRGVCLFAQGEVQTGATVLRPGHGGAGLRLNDRSCHARAIDVGDRCFAIAHFPGRLDRVRGLSCRSIFLFGRRREPCPDAQSLRNRNCLRSGSDRCGHRVHRGPRTSECDERAISGVVGRGAHRARRPGFRRFRTRRPAQIHVAWFPTISLPPKHRHRVPALGDCQHADALWRSADDHQGSLGRAGRSCLRSLEFIFPHHRQSEPNRPAGDVRRLAALAALDHRAASAEYRRRRRNGLVPLRWKPREPGVPAL